MASDVQIGNICLTLLGETRITSLDDAVKPAREIKAIYETTRDGLLAAYNWSFAKDRAQLSALADTPLFDYGYQYQFPSDCLRITFVGDHYVGVDLTDYRGYETEEFTIEGRKILTDMGAPLNIKYIKRIVDASQFHVCFVEALGGRLAAKLAETFTQSASKREAAERYERRYLLEAIRANAIELPPQKFADDEWVMSRR